MLRKILVGSIVGSFILFFGFVLTGTGLFLYNLPGSELPSSYVVGISIMAGVVFIFGLFMFIRAGRLLTGDSRRLSEVIRRGNSDTELPDLDDVEVTETAAEEGQND